MKPVKVGVIGCGNISDIYLETMKRFGILEVVACADLVPERARAKAEQHGIPKSCTVRQLLARKNIEIVVNLTIPAAHAEVALQALEAGKSVYGEKPLAVTREQAGEMMDLANQKGLLIGNAPDTFLGGGHQTCRKLIDDGWIGRPVSMTCFMQCHGHESWHPDPEFYYQTGGGPMFDMGPYYLTALIAMNGPIRRVCASTGNAFSERTITSEPKYGQKIPVNTPTHIAGVLDFANGAICTMVTSFDVWAHSLPNIEVHGETGSMSVPDPNGFGGPIRIRRGGADGWTEMPLSHGYAENSRGLGVADMAYALCSDRTHRASGEMAYHVLDVMHALHESSDKGRHVKIKSTCEQPAPLCSDMPPYVLDA